MRAFELQSNERVYQVFRQTPLILIKSLLLALVIPIIPWYFALTYDLAGFKEIAWIITIGSLSYFLHAHRLWSLQRYYITNKRLIKLYHESIFKKVVLETPLERILNISYKTTGFFSFMLRYGDVEVQVVGLIEPIILSSVRNPAHLKESLWRAHESALKASDSNIGRLQERIGYTKENQRVL